MEQNPSNPSLLSSPPELTPLETEVLEEYERLAENMKKVRSSSHSSNPSSPLPASRAGAWVRLASYLGLTLHVFGNVQLASILDNLASAPTTEILDGLRELERKTSLVFTLLKASVYSIVLQQEIDWGSQDQR